MRAASTCSAHFEKMPHKIMKFLSAICVAPLLFMSALTSEALAQTEPIQQPGPIVPPAGEAPDTPPQIVSQAAHSTPLDSKRWTTDRIWNWYQNQAWPCGFNYLPANTISYTEMWMPYNFDPAQIEKELAMAKADGFNCARVVLPFVVWEHDPAAFKKRLGEFLTICDRNGIKVMFALFDDCAFGHTTDPIYGPQPVVVPGWYANGWTPSPGHKIVRDQTQWPRLEKYVKDVIGSYKNDKRVWIWDLYNEPTNFGLGDTTVPLVNKVFDWAREIEPIQPLTCDVFGTPAMARLALDRSDITSFHNYDPAPNLEANIEQLELAGRPIICTEWLNRAQQSTPQNCLTILAKHNVGAMHWGYVNGRTQTNFPWGSLAGKPSPKLWQHDLYASEYTVESIPAGGYGFGPLYDLKPAPYQPYDAAEIALFKQTIKDAAAKPRPQHSSQKWILPTALVHDANNIWRYTTTPPNGDWKSVNFDVTNWKSGEAGFGTDAPNAWPRTDWSGENIWLRRSFTLEKVPTALTLYAHYDEDIAVFINGVEAFAKAGYTQSYQKIELSAAALKALKAGENVIAVSAHQTTGGQYVDVGLAREAKS